MAGRVKQFSYDDRALAFRLIVELASLYVACDHCGHTRTLRTDNLKKAGDLGVQTFHELCRKIVCSECPRRPLRDRNLTIRPTWRCDEVPDYASA